MSELSIYLTPGDLAWTGWNTVLGPVFRTLVLHGPAEALVHWSRTDEHRNLVRRMARRSVEVEYCVHLASELLPRSLFRRRPELFRANEQFVRVRDANLCPSAPGIEDVLAPRVAYFARALRPSTGRYLWAADDNRPWCFCRACRTLSWSDQNLLFTNHLARLLREVDPRAKAAHLAYKPAIDPPALVRPDPNVFVLFAPIERDYRSSLDAERTARDAYLKRTARELLTVFGRADSEVAEYWLDVSMFSHWMRPRQRIPVPQPVMEEDLAFYRRAGFERIGSFGVWLDRAYARRFGDEALRSFVAAWAHVAARR